MLTNDRLMSVPVPARYEIDFLIEGGHLGKIIKQGIYPRLVSLQGTTEGSLPVASIQV